MLREKTKTLKQFHILPCANLQRWWLHPLEPAAREAVPSYLATTRFPMAAEQYLILCHDGEWKITFNGKQYGPYESREAALEAAVDAAYAMGEIGIDAQVSIQDPDLQVRTAWTYGENFSTSAR